MHLNIFPDLLGLSSQLAINLSGTWYWNLHTWLSLAVFKGSEIQPQSSLTYLKKKGRQFMLA